MFNGKSNKLVRRMVALILIAQCSLLNAYAGDDFGIWGETRAEKGLGTRWNVGAEMTFRSRDNLKSSDRWDFGIDASYKIAPWLKATAGYALLKDHNYKENTDGTIYADYWGTRHRFNVSLTSSVTWNQFTFSLRERWQYTYRPEKTVQRYYTDTGDDAGEKVFRGKGKNVAQPHAGEDETQQGVPALRECRILRCHKSGENEIQCWNRDSS